MWRRRSDETSYANVAIHSRSHAPRGNAVSDAPRRLLFGLHGEFRAVINPTREDILRVLAELSETEPSLRFGQMVANLSYLARDWTNAAIWDVEDEEFLSTAIEHLVARRDSLASPDEVIEISLSQVVGRVGSDI